MTKREIKQTVLRDRYEMLNWIKNTARAEHIPARKLTEAVRCHRDAIHHYLRVGHADPLAKSLSDEWRHRACEDGEHGVDYTFIEDSGETDDEIRDYIESEVGYPEIHSPYDCTGKPFTTSIHWKRTPGGIALIHRWALDV